MKWAGVNKRCYRYKTSNKCQQYDSRFFFGKSNKDFLGIDHSNHRIKGVHIADNFVYKKCLHHRGWIRQSSRLDDDTICENEGAMLLSRKYRVTNKNMHTNLPNWSTLLWSLFSASTRSPRTVQQMHPFITSIISSATVSGKILSSTPISPNSFSITANFIPWVVSFRMRLRRVVLPLPKNPVSTVTGTLVDILRLVIVMERRWCGLLLRYFQEGWGLQEDCLPKILMLSWISWLARIGTCELGFLTVTDSWLSIFADIDALNKQTSEKWYS